MSLRQGIVVQWEVLSSLIVRETRTRYGGARLGYVWALVQTMLGIGFFLGMMVLGRSNPPPGMDVVAFLTTGFLGYEIVTNPIDMATNGVAGNAALLVYPHVRPLDIVISRVCLEAITTSVVFVLIMTANALYLGHVHIDSLWRVIEGFLLGTWLGGSIGLCFSGLRIAWPTFDRIRGFLMRPLFFVSGVFFTANGLPQALRDILVWNPVLHAVEMIRSGWFGSYESDVASPTYVVAWCLVASTLGLMLERSTRSRLEMSS